MNTINFNSFNPITFTFANEDTTMPCSNISNAVVGDKITIMDLTYCGGCKARMFLKEVRYEHLPFLKGYFYSLTIYDRARELRATFSLEGGSLKSFKELMDTCFRDYKVKMDRVVTVEKTETCYRGVLTYRDGTKKYQKCLCNELGLAFDMVKKDKTFKDSIKVEAEKVYLHHLSDTSVEEEPTGEYTLLLSRRSYKVLNLSLEGDTYKGTALNVTTGKEVTCTLFNWIDGVVLDTQQGIVQGKLINTTNGLFVEEEYL